MPAARPSWRGQLRLSLVSIAVEIYPAEKSSARPSFRQIHKPTGKPINYEKVVKGLGPVDPQEIARGYEYEKGQFVLLEEEEIDAVRLETKKTIELVQFVEAREICPYFFDKSYYVSPADELAQDAFRVIRDALRESRKVGLGQMAMRGGEYLVAVQPVGKGLMLNTLHYLDEVRRPEPFFADVSAARAEEDLLDVATALIDKKTAPFDPAAFTDHYQSALGELIATKLESRGKTVKLDRDARPAAGASNVIDLMAALKRSLEGQNAEPKEKPAKPVRRAAAKAEPQPAGRKPTAPKPAARGSRAETRPARPKKAG